MSVEVHEKKGKMLRIRATSSLHQRISRVAAARGISSAGVAREGIIKHVTAEESRLAEEQAAPALPGLEGKA